MAQTGRHSDYKNAEEVLGMTTKKRLEHLLKAELRKSRIPGWQEEERLPVEAVLRLMEKAYNMGKDDAQA